MKLSSPGPVHCEWVILVLLDVTRASQHDLHVTTSFTHAEAGWRHHLIIPTSGMERECFHSCLPHLSPHTSANLCPGAAGGFASNDSTCTTCSFGFPHAVWLLSLPTYGLYWHSWGLSMHFNKNYFVWRCLHKALISFLFSLCFLCTIFSQRRRFYPIGSYAVVLSYYILFASFLCFLLPYEIFKTTSIPLCRAFLFLLWSIAAATYLLMAFRWKCHAVRLINANNII